MVIIEVNSLTLAFSFSSDFRSCSFSSKIFSWTSSNSFRSWPKPETNRSNRSGVSDLIVFSSACKETTCSWSSVFSFEISSSWLRVRSNSSANSSAWRCRNSFCDCNSETDELPVSSKPWALSSSAFNSFRRSRSFCSFLRSSSFSRWCWLLSSSIWSFLVWISSSRSRSSASTRSSATKTEFPNSVSSRGPSVMRS